VLIIMDSGLFSPSCKKANSCEDSVFGTADCDILIQSGSRLRLTVEGKIA